MPIPASINDLSTTAASNSPGGAEDLGTADDYLRTYASYIAALRDVVLSGTANLSTANLTYNGTLTGSTGVINIGGGQIYKDSSGNVGIGTATSVAGRRLIVVGGSFRLDSDVNLEFGGSTAGIYGNSTSNYVVAFTDTTERMRVKSTGQVNFKGLAAAPPGAEGDIYYDNVAKKHYGHDGTTWNAFY